ncbi:hypothetical protein Nepgr_024444 [Nepenthes gracilis]|uniref:Zinc finger PHD-type domain-containing protein n=1 Tax=Nepenthes gracilis TaxID=150966 RepID=A0AAD3T4V2_NEPGR|nr:hypothetical protein Nepgr_024444 [Nepenthes gracilis]
MLGVRFGIGRRRHIKVTSEVATTLGKHCPIGDCHTKICSWESDACAALGSAHTYLKGASSRMERQVVGSSAPLSVKDISCSGRQLENGEASCPFSPCSRHSSFSESAGSKSTFGSSSISECTEIHQSVNAGKTSTGALELNNLDCHGDVISCISKADSTNMMLDKSDPSETSSYRNEPSGVVMLKGESVLCSIQQVDSSLARAVNSDDDKNCNSCMLVDAFEPEPETNDGNQLAADALNCSEQNEHLKLSSALDDINKDELPSQSRMIDDNDRSDTLVDVRVCDICGDVGREALLAVCSKCNDGAEHIYCMLIKMNTVPEGDWMCEDCMVMEKELGQRQAEKSAGATELSSLNEKGQGSGKLNSGVEDSDKIKLKPVCSNSHISVKRPGPNLQVSPAAKRRALEQGLSARNTKTVLQQSSSFKNMSKVPSPSSLASFLDPSSNSRMGKACTPPVKKTFEVELKSAGGSLLQRKLVYSSDSKIKVQPGGDDVRKEMVITNGSFSHNMKGRAFRKLTKSRSFSGACTLRLDASNSRSKLAEDVQSPQRDLEDNILRRSYSLNINRKQPNSPKDDPVISKVKSIRRDAVLGDCKLELPPRKNGHHIKAAQFHGKSNRPKAVGHIHSENSNNANVSAEFVGEKRPSTHAGKLISSPVKTASSYQGAIASPSYKEAEQGLTLRYPNSDLGTSEKALPDTSSTTKDLPMFPSAGSVPFLTFPKNDCIWKGVFKLEKGGKHPSYYNSIQAHLSTCASPKVLEVVNKFPHEIPLEEVPRLDTWPIQFQNNGATEDNIALYFFAEDLQSYTRIYKRLLEYVVMYDLALKANFNGVELLIFSSDVLPERAQRWNNLSFLWGVFRVSKVSSPDYSSVSSSHQRIHNRSLKAATSDKDLSIAVVSEPEKENFSVLADEDLSGSHAFPKSTQGLDFQSAPSIRSCNLKLSPEQKHLGSQKARDLLPGEVDILSATHCSSNEQLSGNLQHMNDLQEEDKWQLAVNVGECREIKNSNNISYESCRYRDINYFAGKLSSGIIDPASQFSSKNETQDTAHGIEMLENSRIHRTSISLDSGPSALSNSGPQRKSDYWQIEQFDGALNLGLSLGSDTKPVKLGGPVFLPDLATKVNDHVHHAKDYLEDDISVALSLALPCSSKEVTPENVLKVGPLPARRLD